MNRNLRPRISLVASSGAGMPLTGIEVTEFAKREFPDAAVISGKEVSDLSSGPYFFKTTSAKRPTPSLPELACPRMMSRDLIPSRKPAARGSRSEFVQRSRERSNSSVMPEQSQEQNRWQRHTEQPKQCAFSKIHVSPPYF